MALLPLLADDNVYGTLIFWGAIGAICVVPSISYYVFRWHKHELDAELKRDMIARGMTADEIERVLAAGGASKNDKL